MQKQTMRIKSWLALATLALFIQSGAMAEPGVYQPLVCRADDPFVFCTQGCKDQDRNWIPTNPTSGFWMAAPGYCPYPNTGPCCIGYVCFKPWTATGVVALGQYQSLCPAGKQQGGWSGSGRPESTPFEH